MKGLFKRYLLGILLCVAANAAHAADCFADFQPQNQKSGGGFEQTRLYMNESPKTFVTINLEK